MPKIESVSVCAVGMSLDRVTLFDARTDAAHHHGGVKARSTEGLEERLLLRRQRGGGELMRVAIR